ncbi:putative ABC transporter permease [Coprococcus sp. AF51-11b1]|uniref:putative ABC transporter permease n=1 Tax=Coprococcus sp. AF51-11b1 TaxID=2997947 RepID=UPI0022DF83B2|nr:putative ABC transporter permease [Coprococcus sp. AF51-11b1]
MWWNRIIFGIDGYEVVMWFLTYSMMGWLVESIYMSFCNHKITNRGFAKGPFCPIYGFGALTVFFILRPYSDNSILLFFLGSFLATTLEFLTALVMKRIFGEIWWDYHEKPFNYRGIICLESSIAWGFYTLFLFMFLQNIVAAFVAMIPVRAGRVIGNLILIGYIMDFSATIYRQKKENLQESMDEEQIQQIEQARDKMKDNFLT